MIAKMPPTTLYSILSGDDLSKDQLRTLLDGIVGLSLIIEGSGAPTIQANKHSWYFDTATSKYYRNTDGGTTWVALN